MARPFKEDRAKPETMCRLMEMAWSLRAAGRGWAECARRVNGRFRSINVGERTLPALLARNGVEDPQASMTAEELLAIRRERARRVVWRKRYAEYRSRH